MQFIAVTRYIQGNLTLRKTYVDRLTALVIDFLVSHTLIVVRENRAQLVLHSHVRCIFRRTRRRIHFGSFNWAPLMNRSHLHTL